MQGEELTPIFQGRKGWGWTLGLGAWRRKDVGAGGMEKNLQFL
jgi:hypothetical protein